MPAASLLEDASFLARGSVRECPLRMRPRTLGEGGQLLGERGQLLATDPPSDGA
jgi:hypothetical protein